MKYLKKFNEELDKKTLLSASKKSLRYSHIKKSLKFFSHIYINNIKKYGSVTMDMSYGGRGEHPGSYDKFNLDFYPFIDFIEKSSGVKKYSYNNNKYSFELVFNVYAFPKNEEDINIIIKTSNKYGDLIEKLKIGSIKISYDISDPNGNISEYEFKFGEIYFNNSVNISTHDIRISYIKDKKSAVSLKRNILACFEMGSQYPTMDDSYQNSYDQLFQFLNNSGFTLEYGHTMDDIYNDIKSYSSNNFYSE